MMDYPLLIEAKKEIDKYLDKFGVNYGNRDIQESLRAYFNLKHKLIDNKIREVYKANHIENKALELSLSKILDTIENLFKKGYDINPYLSKSALNPDNDDSLLNDWAIHHIHLSDTKDELNNYFFSRSDFLLFVHIENDKVYFIDIRPHKEEYVFAQKDLLRIIRDNWKELNDKFIVGNGEMRMEHDYSEKDISVLRKKGYMFFTQVDDSVYSPGLGSATSGFSMKAGMEMNNFLRHLYDYQLYLDKNKNQLKKQLEKKIGKKIYRLEFTVKLIDGLFYIFEKKTNSYFA